MSPPFRLAVRVTPKGGRDGVDGWAADEAGRLVLKVRVSSPPADGAANAAVVALIAKALKVPKSAVRIAAGDTARVKRLEIDGVGPVQIALAFGPPPGEG
ncbi:DUF167 family protein [Phenylobacterium sp.]|uniref:DUF167 domain-containing protein n=1 Tax=Phenylobacterium sp. TaxID=1871053 RepID=UPI00301C6743